MCLVGNLRWQRDAAEAVDALYPVVRERLVDNAVAARSMVEAILVSNDADVSKATEEYERAEFELLFLDRRGEAREEMASAHSLKADPSRLKNTPDKS